MYAVWVLLHFKQRHRPRRPERRTLLGRCLHAPPCRLPSIPTSAPAPGRRPYKRNAAPGAAPPFLHRNGAPDNHASQALQPLRAALGVLRSSPHKEHFAGTPTPRPTPREQAIETAWSPNKLRSKPLGAQTSWRPKHRERPKASGETEFGGEFGRVWESLGEASFGEPALLLLSRRRGQGRCDGRSLALRGGVTGVPSAVVVAR